MSLPKYGVLLTPKYGQKCKFKRVTQNLRGFAYIVRVYKSAAEATPLLSLVASLAITINTKEKSEPMKRCEYQLLQQPRDHRTTTII